MSSKVTILAGFAVISMTILLLRSAAWTQDPHELKQSASQPLQTEIEDRDHNSIERSKEINIHRTKAKNPKKPRVTERINPKGERLGLSGQYGMSKNRSNGSQINAFGTDLGVTGSYQSGSIDSKSFLDGYLLKSLQDKDLTRKKVKSESGLKDNLNKKAVDINSNRTNFK